MTQELDLPIEYIKQRSLLDEQLIQASMQLLGNGISEGQFNIIADSVREGQYTLRQEFDLPIDEQQPLST
jgi:hypothetical protein